jgi:hypothetical protein
VNHVKARLMSQELVDKKEIIQKVQRFVRHRERMMSEHGALKTLSKVQSATRILRILNYFKDKNTLVISRQILKLRKDFNNILPGRTSKFYESDIKKVNEIFSICENINT